MIREIPAIRAIGLTCAITVACVAAATADEIPAPAPVVVPETKPAAPAAPPPVPAAEPEPDWVRQGLYFGPAFGVADTDGGTEFGWGLNVLYRAFRYGGFQLEYLNLGPENGGSGDFDGLYLGLMPTLPLVENLSVFLQGGGIITSDEGDAGVGGGGVLYDLPLEPIEKYLPGGLSLRADYKYMAFDDAAHLVTAGIMYRFGFVKKK
jgi:hypothetical protein